MTARWGFRPPVNIEDDTRDVVIEGDHVSRAANITWDQESVGRIRAGYQCLKCWEPHEEAFPVECGNPMCRYPMRRLQAEDFAKQFRGTVFYGPEITEEELAAISERAERRKHNKDHSIFVPKQVQSSGGVILPRGVDVS